MSVGNMDVEKQLDELPEKVADALATWRVATLDREKVEAILYASIRGEGDEVTATGIKAKINASGDRYKAVLEEIKAEANYKRLEETLMAAKKRASLRTAY